MPAPDRVANHVKLRAASVVARLSLAIALSGCGASGAAVSPGSSASGATGTSAPIASPTPMPDPTPSPQSTSLPTVGGCVHTGGTPIGFVKEFRAVECTSPEADYRVVAKVATSILCPSTAEYSVDKNYQTYCLSDQLFGEEVPAIDDTVAEGDCIDVVGAILIETLHKIECTAKDADYRVVRVVAYSGDCPKSADTHLDLTGIRTTPKRLCLETL